MVSGAGSASGAWVKGSVMPNSSDHPDFLSTPNAHNFVRIGRNDLPARVGYHPNMPRKASPSRTIGPDWHLAEWMGALGVTQAELGRLCDWSKATVNDIYHGKTEYYRAIVNRIATALRIEPWELMMPVEQAMQIRRLRAAVDSEVQLRVAEERATLTPPEPASDRLRPRRAS